MKKLGFIDGMATAANPKILGESGRIPGIKVNTSGEAFMRQLMAVVKCEPVAKSSGNLKQKMAYAGFVPSGFADMHEINACFEQTRNPFRFLLDCVRRCNYNNMESGIIHRMPRRLL